jgi:predicted DNA-binding WGR domain protein
MRFNPQNISMDDQPRYLQQIDPGRNRARWYEVHLEQVAVEAWAVTRRWGRVGKTLKERRVIYSEEALAQKVFERIVASKTKRGYRDVDLGHVRANKRPPGPEDWGQLRLPLY